MAGKFEILVSASLSKEATSKIQSQLNKIASGISLNVSSNGVTGLNKTLLGLQNTMNDTNNYGSSLTKTIENFSNWKITQTAINGVKEALSSVVEEVKDLDSSLVEFQKVTDLTDSELDSFIQKSFDTAEAVARTGREAIDAATKFSKAGYKDQASDLAEVALLYQNIADEEVNVSTTTNLIVSQMKAFNVQADDAISIIDKINEVSNNFAVSSSDLATAIPRVSATLAQAGNSMDETIALITAGTEIMTGQASRVARGLRSITLNLQGLDDEGEQNLELVAKMESDFNKLGITLYDSSGQMKSTFDILSDLAEVYPSLDQNTKNYYAALIGGKTQVDVVNSVLQNFQTALNATEKSLNSTGSAIKENETYMDSIEGHLKQLESAWQEFATNTLEADTVKGFIDAGKAALEFIDKIGGLPTIIMNLTTLLAMSKVPKGIENIKNLGASSMKLSGDLGAVISLSKETGQSILSVGLQTASAATKMALFSASIMGVIAVVGLLATAYVAYKKHVEEVREENINAANEASETIKKREEEKEAIEKVVAELQKEKEAKEDLNGTNSATLKVIDKEIKKRQENIDKMQEEIDKNKTLLKSKLSSLGDTSSRFTSVVGMGYKTTPYLSIEDANIIASSRNVADLRKNIEDLLVSYQKKKENEEEGSLASQKYQKAIDKLNETLNNSEEVYNSNKQVAQTYYDALYKGGLSVEDLTKDQVQMIKDYLNLNDDMIEQASKGIDTQAIQTKTGIDYSKVVDNESAALAILNATTAKNYNLTEEQTASLEKWSDAQLTGIETAEEYDKVLNDISQSSNLFSNALKEQSENGSISEETLSELLATNEDYSDYISYENGQIKLNEDAFKLLTKAKLSEIEATLESQKTTLEAKLNRETETADRATTAYKKLASAKMLASMSEGSSQKYSIEGGITPKDIQSKVSGTNTQQALEALNQRQKNLQDIISQIDKISTKTTGATTRAPKSTSPSASSAQSKYKATVDLLYSYTNALEIAKAQVDQLKESLDDTESFDEQEQYIRELINALNNQINKTNNLKNAQSDQINNYIDELRNAGFAIDYNVEKNELYINNMEHLADFSGDTAKSLEKMISKIQELNTNNRNLDSSVRSLTKNVKDYYSELENFPEQKLKKFNELMEDFQNSQLQQVQNQITDLEKQLEDDPRIKALDKQIEALENQNEELDKQKELEEKILAVEEAKEKLANIKRQKNIQVYTKDKGWIWTADLDEIKDTQKELEDAQNNLQDKIKQDEIDRLKEEKEQIENSYQDKIDALQKFLDDQNYLIDKASREEIETFEELRNKLAEFGLDNAQYLGMATNWLNKYNQALAKLNNSISSVNMNNSGNGVLYNSAIKDRIENALSSLISSESLQRISDNIKYDKVDTNTNNSNIYIDRIELPNVSNAEDFVEALKDLPRLAASQSSKRK